MCPLVRLYASTRSRTIHQSERKRAHFSQNRNHEYFKLEKKKIFKFLVEHPTHTHTHSHGHAENKSQRNMYSSATSLRNTIELENRHSLWFQRRRTTLRCQKCVMSGRALRCVTHGGDDLHINVFTFGV